MNPHVRHRGGLATRVMRLTPDPTLFARIGGREVVSVLVEELYDRIEADPRLSPKFSHSKLERANQKKFFEEWLGGEPLYSQHVGSAGLRLRHSHIHINADDAKAWLGHFRAAMVAAKIDGQLRRVVLQTLRPLAEALVNEERDAVKGEHRCHRTKPADAASNAAYKGDMKAVRQVVGDQRLLDEAGPAMLLAAAGRGRVEVVRELLVAGVDPNIASFTGWGNAYHTPICIARQKRKAKVVDLLVQYGAIDDIFTQATLGDVSGVKDWLAKDPSLANASDPAQDFFRVTPLHNAVFAQQREVAEFLLDHGAEVGPLSTRLTQSAAEQSDIELVKLLLNHGADASRVGVGRWVLDKKLAKLLTTHGADVNYESDPWGSWLWQSCTGNHSQKDDPDYVKALIAHGVKVNAVHEYWGRAALHFAAKAGFAQTIEVLLAHGADPNLPDAKKEETPLFYAFKAGKSVDPQPVVKALLDAGADPRAKNWKGQTVVSAHPKSRKLLGDKIT